MRRPLAPSKHFYRKSSPASHQQLLVLYRPQTRMRAASMQLSKPITAGSIKQLIPRRPSLRRDAGATEQSQSRGRRLEGAALKSSSFAADVIRGYFEQRAAPALEDQLSLGRRRTLSDPQQNRSSPSSSLGRLEATVCGTGWRKRWENLLERGRDQYRR